MMPLIHFKWNKDYEILATQIIKEDDQVQPSENYLQGEKQSKSNWNKFYNHHQRKYFHHRHYLDREFPELKSIQDLINKDKFFYLCELGCGVGDTVFPLADIYPNLNFQCCDLSDTAISCLKQCPSYNEERI
jgi:tRNAThr (cytosine32-N3)-methyltransferase